MAKHNRKSRDYRENLLMIVGIIIMLIGTLWIIKESIEKKQHLYTTGTVTEVSESGIKVTYRIAFEDIEKKLNNPNKLDYKMGKKINIKLNKETKEITKGSNTTFAGLIVFVIGLAVLVVQALTIQAKEQLALKTMQAKKFERSGMTTPQNEMWTNTNRNAAQQPTPTMQHNSQQNGLNFKSKF